MAAAPRRRRRAALVGLLGAVLVVSAPECPGVAVGLVAAGVGDNGAAELSQQLGDGDGDQLEDAGAGVCGALAGGGHGEECAGEQADRGPAVPGGPCGDLAAVQPLTCFVSWWSSSIFQRVTATW